jgi:hypothetical protein
MCASNRQYEIRYSRAGERRGAVADRPDGSAGDSVHRLSEYADRTLSGNKDTIQGKAVDGQAQSGLYPSRKNAL